MPRSRRHGSPLPGRLLWALLLVLPGSVAASEPAPPPAQAADTPPPPEEIRQETIEARVKQVQEAAELDEATRTALLDAYRQALQELAAAREWSAHGAQHQQVTTAIDERLRESKKKLAELPTDPRPELPRTDSLRELEQLLDRKLAELENPDTGLKKEAAQLEAEPARRAARRKEFPSLSAAAEARLAEVRKQLDAPAPAGELTQMTQARRSLLLARRQSLEQELSAYRHELSRYDASDGVDLLRVRRDLLSRQVALAEREVQMLRDMVNRQRRRDAETREAEARRKAIQTSPQLRPLAEANTVLAQEETSVTASLQQTSRELAQTTKVQQALESEFERIQEIVKSVGESEYIGLMLRQQRTELPDVRRYRRSLDDLDGSLQEVQLRLFQLDDERTELADVEHRLRNVVAAMVPPETPEEREELENAVRDLLSHQRDQLDALIRSYTAYLETATKLHAAQKNLIEQVAHYQAYIDERVLWIRTNTGLDGAAAARAGTALVWLADAGKWTEIGSALAKDAGSSPIQLLFAVLILGPLFYLRRRFRNDLKDLGDTAARATCREFFPTAQAAALTAVQSAFWPALIWYVGWRIGIVADSVDLAGAASAGLIGVAGMLLPMESFRKICMPRGLAETHFGWPPGATRLLRKHLRWLIFMLVPCAFLTASVHALENEPWRDSLGRICFIAGLGLIALFAQRVLHPDRDLLAAIGGDKQSGWSGRLAPLWTICGISAPLALAVLAWLGYYYTALQLAWRLQASLCLLAGLVVLRAVVLRWLLLKRRRLAYEQARARRAAAESETRNLGEAGTVAQTSNVPHPEQKLDLAAMSTQTQRLLQTGFVTATLIGVWFIWVDVLPALNALDRYAMWHTTAEVTKEVTRPDGGREIKQEVEIRSVTLGDLALSLVIMALATIAGRNIPGLLEISMLQRLPMEQGLRYAISSIASYIVVSLGIVMAFATLGIGWSKIQWLAAAATVGLGFGLQEIFANFVSGLIILFERPIRVGDVVTIGDVTGVVSRIRIRATTITNWDRKELIVPNKEFITGRLLNWTLSDQINRVVVNVGVAYGSDTELAREILIKVARENKFVLDDPPPIAVFDNFGDSSLNFALRAYLPNLENRLPVIHDLHTSIHRSFVEAGIEIAFPQRDLHIRTVPEFLQSGRQLLPPLPVAANGNGRHD